MFPSAGAGAGGWARASSIAPMIRTAQTKTRTRMCEASRSPVKLGDGDVLVGHRPRARRDRLLVEARDHAARGGLRQSHAPERRARHAFVDPVRDRAVECERVAPVTEIPAG